MNDLVDSLKKELKDPFTLWQKYSSLYSAKLRIDPGQAFEAEAIVRGAFGDEWLLNVFNKELPKDRIIPKAPHRLDRIFSTPGERHIVELMELAAYLKTFREYPEIVSRDRHSLKFVRDRPTAAGIRFPVKTCRCQRCILGTGNGYRQIRHFFHIRVCSVSG